NQLSYATAAGPRESEGKYSNSPRPSTERAAVQRPAGPPLDFDASRSSCRLFRSRRSESSVSGGCSLMADSLVAGLSLNDVRASVKRAQTEGRKLVTRLRKDATSMVNRRPLDVLSDARKRAGKAFEELDVQQRRLRTFVVGRLAGFASEAVTRVGLASAHDVADLKRRLGELERRLERVTKHQAA